MSKTIEFPDDNMVSIEIVNTPEMIAMGHKMSEAMGTANLTGDQIDILRTPIFDYVHQGLHDAFLQGFEIGLRLALEGGDPIERT